jgi:CRP/FNR family transcriptional regulator, cyclic AMP receptor protein
MKILESTLADYPFFQGLTPEHLHRISECASHTSLGAGTYLFLENEPATHFYIIRRGKVALETSDPHLGIVAIETINGGDVLGWSWLFAPYRWHFSARAVESCGVIMLDAIRLREQCEQDHDFGYELVKRCAGVIMERLQVTRKQLLDAYNIGMIRDSQVDQKHGMEPGRQPPAYYTI